ncbi:hypothetical protein VOLCADRAFT_99741 [Volvox carteri f. nagariensis]|uniref:Uncharacterized protein n=1 Tax=Volvox carteri f. nagariensis TaxID=3068 RepID=D8UIJ2_VOLCA|nr:uncharacterized protein VOLCADRAFT_99741 [Volvox carteri f. nagariensis]EFJ40462.1 hypothetical protein VOLCADRAFT_99741 [Volvox carteri f. nagariensis]|eukprot:XP_002958462.1 hypothetical protein VOLCADRAFT_99741 [Volvox carteri f. nagariensis]
MQPGIIYGPNGTATACWLPGQLNGFVPQLSAQGYVQPQFPPELQFPGGAHGYPQQVPPFPSLPGYPQPGPILAEPGQVLSLPNPNGNLQPLAGMPAVGLPGTGPVLFHQQPHTHMEHPQSQQAVATSLEPPAAALQALPNSQQQPQQLLNEGSREGQQQLAGRVAAEQGVDAGVDGVACAATATATRGNGTAAAAAGVLPVPGSPTPQLHQQHQQQHQQHSQHQTAIKATNSDDSLGSAFGDVEEFTRDFGRIPSPPPLPADFHSAANGGTNGMLFNFAQFSQKLPRSQSQTRLDKNLSAVGLGLDNGLDADLLYDHSDDGDLMQLLFGVPDELPTMATIHLHKWSNGDEEEEEVLEPGGNGGERSGLAAATAAAGPGPSSSGRVGGGDADGALSHPFDRTSSHVVEGTTTAAVTSQQQHHHQPGEESVVGTPVLAAGEEQQPHQQRHEHQHQQGQSGVINLKTELLLDGHLHEPGPEPYLVHGGSVGGGKVALGQLVNGLSSNQSHPGDEHHREDHSDAKWTDKRTHGGDSEGPRVTNGLAGQPLLLLLPPPPPPLCGRGTHRGRGFSLRLGWKVEKGASETREGLLPST